MFDHSDETEATDVALFEQEDKIPLRPAYGHPQSVPTTWSVPTHLHLAPPEIILQHKVKRLHIHKIRRVIHGGDFRTSEQIIDTNTLLPAGTMVTVWRLAPDARDDKPPEPTIIHNNPLWIVLNKSAPLAVHPTARYLIHTVTGWLKNNHQKANPVHRLDRETSGVLVCAHTSPEAVALFIESHWKKAFAAEAMHTQKNDRFYSPQVDITVQSNNSIVHIDCFPKEHIASHRPIQKSYIAIVRGQTPASFYVDAPLLQQGSAGLVRLKMLVDYERGLPAMTHFTTLAYNAHRHQSVVLAEPFTGKQHQIRVHLAFKGFPLVGDKLYGMPEEWFDAMTRGILNETERTMIDHPRHALHAWQLSARIPALSQDVFQYTAAMPDDMRQLISEAVAFDKHKAYLEALMAAVNSGTTLNKSPTIP